MFDSSMIITRNLVFICSFNSALGRSPQLAKALRYLICALQCITVAQGVPIVKETMTAAQRANKSERTAGYWYALKSVHGVATIFCTNPKCYVDFWVPMGRVAALLFSFGDCPLEEDNNDDDDNDEEEDTPQYERATPTRDKVLGGPRAC